MISTPRSSIDPSVLRGLAKEPYDRYVTQQDPRMERRKMLGKAMAWARTYDLDREDRLALAENLLWRDVNSWKDLTDEELVRLLDCLEGYHLIGTLRLQRTEPLPLQRIKRRSGCSPTVPGSRSPTVSPRSDRPV